MAMKIEKKVPVLPQILFVRYSDPELPEEDDDQFLMDYRTLEDAAEAGVRHLVGVYELKEVRAVELQVTEHLIYVPVKSTK